jgi:hypothetical protein
VIWLYLKTAVWKHYFLVALTRLNPSGSLEFFSFSESVDRAREVHPTASVDFAKAPGLAPPCCPEMPHTGTGKPVFFILSYNIQYSWLTVCITDIECLSHKEHSCRWRKDLYHDQSCLLSKPFTPLCKWQWILQVTLKHCLALLGLGWQDAKVICEKGHEHSSYPMLACTCSLGNIADGIRAAPIYLFLFHTPPLNIPAVGLNHPKKFFFLVFSVLGMKHRALHMLSKCCTTKLHPQPKMRLEKIK